MRRTRSEDPHRRDRKFLFHCYAVPVHLMKIVFGKFISHASDCGVCRKVYKFVSIQVV